MAKRMFFMLAVLIAILAGLGYFKYRQVKTASKRRDHSDGET
jgi:hypothetical protein